jgi:hypothetical protein
MVRELSYDLLEQAMETGGRHSTEMGAYTAELLGELNGDQRKVLGLMEALDFGCFEESNRAWDCITLGSNTIEDVKSYLIEHVAVVKSLPSPPSLTGELLGTFSFIYEGAT